MKTKLYLLTGLLAMGALVLLVKPQSGNATIVGSKHDFSALGWAGGEICKPCHTPHNADTTVTDSPLWNHEVTTATFSVYNNSRSATMDATVGQPSGASKLCLSCHDGTVALDSYGGATGATLIGAVPANLGTELHDDHPISFVYDTTLANADGELTDPSADNDLDASTVKRTAGNVALPLFGSNNTLECATCHDVHNSELGISSYLLRETPNGSAICLNCHQK